MASMLKFDKNFCLSVSVDLSGSIMTSAAPTASIEESPGRAATKSEDSSSSFRDNWLKSWFRRKFLLFAAEVEYLCVMTGLSSTLSKASVSLLS